MFYKRLEVMFGKSGGLSLKHRYELKQIKQKDMLLPY